MSGPSNLRVADADREQAIEELREHAGAGRLTAEELEDRVGKAYEASTRADLDALRADLPISSTSVKLALVKRKGQLRRRVLQEAGASIGVSLLAVGIWLASGPSGSFWPGWVIAITLLPVVRDTWHLLGPASDLDVVEARLQARHERQLSRGRTAATGTAGCPARERPGRRHRARARRRSGAPPREGARAGQARRARAHRAAARRGLLRRGSAARELAGGGARRRRRRHGRRRIDSRTVALMANDPTVKAGSWGPKTVEKILRIQERALALEIPMVYLVDSAGARITEQVQMFPGRRGAGRIFHNQVKLSGKVPQVCVLFGPSAAGGAYIPAFCDIVIMRDGNASMYLGSPRMAEMVIGEKVSLEQMGGARMHTGVSGCGHQLVKSDEEGIALARRYLSYLPGSWREEPPLAPPRAAADGPPIAELIPSRREQAV